MINNTKWCFVLIIALVLLGSAAVAIADENRTGTLTVVISDFQSSDGNAMVALSNSRESYEQGPDAAFAKRKSKVADGTARVVFKDLPYGEYGISLYHDRNSNGELDRNVMGIPAEPYAFSKNARGMFGKPDWDKVRFAVNSAAKQIKISFK